MLHLLFFIISCALYTIFFVVAFVVFFFKQKTAYEMRISDWSSDVCSSDLAGKVAHEFRGTLSFPWPATADAKGKHLFELGYGQIGRASCRERVCQYV